MRATKFLFGGARSLLMLLALLLPSALLLPLATSLSSLWSLSLPKLMLMLCYDSCYFYCYCYSLLSAGEAMVIFGLDSMILDWNPASSGVTVPQFSTQIMRPANPTTFLNKKTV